MKKATGLQAAAYTSVEDVYRSLLHNIRRFRKIELAIKSPTILNPRLNTKVPVTKKRADDVERLDTMLSQVVLLKNMNTQLVTRFQGNPKAKSLVKTIDDLINDVQRRSEELRVAIDKDSRQKVSQAMVRLNHNLMKLLSEDMKGFFSDIKEFYMVSTISMSRGGDPVPAEIAFIHIDNLKGSDGYIHPQFYIILAHPVNVPKAPLVMIATSPKFRVPNRQSWDRTAKNGSEIHKIVRDLLTQDGIFGKSFTRNIPVPKSRIKFTHDNVKSTTVRGDDIVIKVVDAKKIDATCKDILGQLASIVRQVDPKNKDLIRHKIERDTGIIRLRFSLPAKMRGRIVPDNQLRDIQRLLNVDDATLQRIKTAIEDPS